MSKATIQAKAVRPERVEGRTVRGSTGSPRTGVRLGAHMSIAGGFEFSIERGLKVGCDTLQIFSKNNNQWKAPPITSDQAARFKKALADSGIGPVFAHSAYLINIGSPDKATHAISKEALKVELERANVLGLSFLVLHPGAHKQTDEASCIKRIAQTAAWALDQAKGPVKLLYEIAAGQGSCIGHRFEQLADLLRLTARPERTGICLDTCHLFAAGYDVRTKAAYDKTMADFDRIVGIKNIQAIHLNDSKKELGCRVDRHEHIGQGKIGLEGFRCLLNDARFAEIPMVLETPKDEECTEDKMNLKTLRGLIR